MSTRERWIVYPLLFLALGIELRDKMVPCSQIQTAEVMAKQIRCEQLQVGQIFCDRVEAGQSVCRSLAIAGPDGQPVVRAGADNRGWRRRDRNSFHPSADSIASTLCQRGVWHVDNR